MIAFRSPVLTVLVWFIVGFCGEANAQRLKSDLMVIVRPETSARLMADFRAATEDRPIRSSLEAIARSAKLNLIFDRRSDPTQLVSSDPDSKTAFQAILSLARSAGLQAVAVDNFVIVGLDAWVADVLAAAIQSNVKSQATTIAWPELTTPDAAAHSLNLRRQTTLPHDLWPAANWSDANPQLAHLMIASQFDLMPSATLPITYRKLTPPTKVSALYPRGSHMTGVRNAVSNSDAKATFKEIDGYVSVAASPAAHAEGIRAWLSASLVNAAAPLDIDKIKFTLRIENAKAGQVLRQIASSAGRELVMMPTAETACMVEVSMSANDESLRDLAQRIADVVKVHLNWTNEKLTVSVDAPISP